jgi:hypothetical protein
MKESLAWKYGSLLWWLLVGLCGVSSTLHGAEGTPQRYIVHPATGKLEIDGRLDEPSWQRIAWTDPFRDIEGCSTNGPEFHTRCKMLWDDSHLYVAADLQVSSRVGDPQGKRCNDIP